MADNMFTAPEDMRRVVLCKDCVHYKPMLKNREKYYCDDMMGLLGMGPEDYCSYGRRRDGDEAQRPEVL